jgi:hypothetical protein
MQYEILEKFIKGEKIENLTPVIEYLRQHLQHDGNFYHYLIEKYPPKTLLTDQIGHRQFLLAEWMGRLYPCWTTGHSEKNAKVFQNPPIPFAVTFDGQVYAAEGENQYWQHYHYFDDCNSIDDFKNRLKELKAENVFGIDGGIERHGTEQPDKSKGYAETLTKEEEAKTEAEIETKAEVCLSLF